MWRCRQGFTLVELVVTVAIIVLIGGVTTLSIPRLMDEYRLKQAQAVMGAIIREAQVNAYRNGGSWRVRVDDTGTGLLLEKATGERWDCDATGWTTVRVLPLDVVNIGDSSRSCISFGPSGRVSVPSPTATAVPPGEDYTGQDDSSELTDGNLMTEVWPDPQNQGGWYHWWAGEPLITVTIDVGEARYFRTLEPGILNDGITSYYPKEIQVRGMAGETFDAAALQCIGDYVVEEPPGGGNPVMKLKTVLDPGDDCPAADAGAGSPSVTISANCDDLNICRFPIPVYGEYRHFEVRFVPPDGIDLYLDEIDLGGLFFAVNAHDLSGTTTVNPVTGRVTSK